MVYQSTEGNESEGDGMEGKTEVIAEPRKKDV